MSPSVPEEAVAEPSWNSVAPSNEMARFRSDVAAAGTAPPLRRLSIDDSQSLDESADATGEWATAAPTPNATASMPSRAIPSAFTIGSPFSAAPRQAGD